MSMRPDDPIVLGYLRHSLVARVATCSRGGRPALTPLWFVVERRHLIMATGAATLAARNASANPEVAILLDGEAAGRSEYVLQLRGRAEVRVGFPSWGALARLALKYYISPPAARVELTHAAQWWMRQRYYAQGKAAFLEVVPETAELLHRPR